MKNKKKVILDTDIFGDADDFFALLYALSYEEIDIQLIITTDEYKTARAQQLKVLLEYLKRPGIPVVAGSDLGNNRLLFVKNYQHVHVDTDFEDRIKKIIDQEQEITYLCIGPQSNLMSFLNKYPSYNNKFKIMIMGGSLNSNRNKIEHNLRYDIKAAQEVLASFETSWLLSDQTSVDELNFSPQTDLYKQIKKIKNKTSEMLLYSAHGFFDNLYPESRFHDPLLISCLISNFVKFKKTALIIKDDGVMYEDSKGFDASVSVKVNYKIFIDDFNQRILDQLKLAL